MSKIATRGLVLGLALAPSWCVIGQTIRPIQSDSIPLTQDLRTLVFEATRAHERVPMTYTDISLKEIAPLNTGQDLPYVLRFTPSLVVTSDAGNGIGYTGLWIRGSDPSRVNISINGIPLNDPESQQVFWVNTPDLASSSGQIQIQRGVGTSSNGSAAFGGLIKVETNSLSRKPFSRVENSWGSFNSRKHSVQVGTGLIGDRFILEGRLSRVASDGYIDRARTGLFGYSVSGTLLGKKSEFLITTFGGREETYQSWYGSPAEVVEGADQESRLAFAARNSFTEAQTQNLLQSGRTYNFYTYEDQVDRYGQDHFQAHYKYRLHDNLHVNVSGHYTRGKGYFEEYREDDSRTRYGLNALLVGSDTVDVSDVIRRRWLDNHFYGAVFSVKYVRDANLLTVGGALNEYRGDHFGELRWLQWAGELQPGQRYYEGSSLKRDVNMYARYIHHVKNGWNIYGDVQVRAVSYVTDGIDNDLRAYDVDDALLFVNPKIGLNYNIDSESRAYFSVAVGNKEPNRNDYVDAQEGMIPRPERMLDFEAGFQRAREKGSFGINLYYMDYTDQLVLTGTLNDVGAPLRTNVDDSYRVGIELEGEILLHKNWRIISNLTLSDSRVRSFREVIYDYTEGFEVVEIEHANTPISFSPRVVGMAGLTGRIGGFRTKPADGRASVISHWEWSWMQKLVSEQHLDNTGNMGVMIDGYSTGDMMLSYVSEYVSGHEWRLNFWLNNVLNAKFSSNGYTYSYIYESRITERFYYPQAGRNFMLGLNLLF